MGSANSANLNRKIKAGKLTKGTSFYEGFNILEKYSIREDQFEKDKDSFYSKNDYINPNFEAVFQLLNFLMQRLCFNIAELKKLQQHLNNISNKRPLNPNINDEELKVKIGRGAQATVYRIFDKADRKFYAQRIEINKDYDSSKEEDENIGDFDKHIIFSVKLLLDLMAIDDQRLIKIHQIHYKPGEEFSVWMDYGFGTLEEFICFIDEKRSKKEVSEDEINDLYINIIAQVFHQALILRNKFKIYHRDIKPSNIVITKEGYFKLVDFGLAKQLKSTENEFDEHSVCGTFEFMCQELREAFNKNEKKAFYNIWDGEKFSIKKIASEILRIKMPEDDKIDLLSCKDVKDKKIHQKIFEDFDKYTAPKFKIREKKV